MHKFSNKLKTTPKSEGARRVTVSKSYAQDPPTLNATAENLVARAAWCLGFVQPT